MADETLDGGLCLAAINIGVTVSEKIRPQASH